MIIARNIINDLVRYNTVDENDENQQPVRIILIL